MSLQDAGTAPGTYPVVTAPRADPPQRATTAQSTGLEHAQTPRGSRGTCISTSQPSPRSGVSAHTLTEYPVRVQTLAERHRTPESPSPMGDPLTTLVDQTESTEHTLTVAAQRGPGGCHLVRREIRRTRPGSPPAIRQTVAMIRKHCSGYSGPRWGGSDAPERARSPHQLCPPRSVLDGSCSGVSAGSHVNGAPRPGEAQSHSWMITDPRAG
jgi:hypothetical protein